MAEVTIKGLKALEDKFKAAARAYSDADAKASKKNPLRIQEANDAFQELQMASIRYIQVLLTGHDGKRIGAEIADWFDWMDHEGPDGIPNGDVIAAAIRGLSKKPYAVVFKLAELRAAKGSK